jgi:competence protein ComGF
MEQWFNGPIASIINGRATGAGLLLVCTALAVPLLLQTLHDPQLTLPTTDKFQNFERSHPLEVFDMVDYYAFLGNTVASQARGQIIEYLNIGCNSNLTRTPTRTTRPTLA